MSISQYVNMSVSLYVSALNAADQLTVIAETETSVAFTWSLPAGYYDGFHVYGNASSRAAMNCTDTVYGKSYICRQLGHLVCKKYCFN